MEEERWRWTGERGGKDVLHGLFASAAQPLLGTQLWHLVALLYWLANYPQRLVPGSLAGTRSHRQYTTGGRREPRADCQSRG